MPTRKLMAVAVGAVLTATVAASPAAAPASAGRAARSRITAAASNGGTSSTLPVQAIEAVLEAKGTVDNGALSVGIDRTDIDNVTLHGVPIKPAFQINHELTFQPLGPGRAFFNADLALKPAELNPVIDAIVRNGLVLQGEHQHMYEFQPMLWFIHLRGTGNPLQLATAAHNVLKATSTPLPQPTSSTPTTPLDKNRLQRILHGFSAEVGEDGVVTVYVARRNPEYINGIDVQPQANIATNVAFEPLNATGTRAAAIPDFGMVASEVNPVMRVMRARGWDIGCLYNQETAETPQLYFSHQFKTGNPYQLATEIRRGLDQTNSR